MIVTAVLICMCICTASAAQEAKAPPAAVPNPAPAGAAAAQTFDTPRSAADALVKAAGDFDQVALVRIFGEDARDIAFTGEFPQARG